MVEEKLFPIGETIMVVPSNIRITPIQNGMYRFDWNFTNRFTASWEYYYDGAKFFIGHNVGQKNLSILEPMTMAYAVLECEFNCRKPQEIIEKFKQKLYTDKRGRNIHEVIRDCKNNNIETNLCLTSLLIM